MIDKHTAKEIALSCGFKLKQQPNGKMDLNPYVYDTLNKAIVVYESKKNSGWISVDDDLPDNESEVLGYRESFKYGDLIYHCVFKDGLFLDKLTFNLTGKGKITHWQPLPQPPKELQDE